MMLGVFPVGCETQHRSKITLKENSKLVLLRNEADPRDQRPDRFFGLCPGGLVLQAVVKRRNLLAIQLRHVRMKQGPRGRGLGQPFLNLRLARFKLLHACLECRAGKAIENCLNGLIQFALDFGKFGFQSDQIGPFFHSQAVDLTGKLVTKFLKEGWIHHLGLQAIQNRFFQNVPPDCQTVVTGALVAGG
ncbi:hypothetical protein RYF71_03350 [Wolbachia endosymbiont of Drosophila malagassya]|nr:hypothetical protein [Wolbachia endosymbiont of Drosophila malagassya]